MILQKTKNYSPDKLNSIKQLSDYKDLVLQYAPIENEYRYALREMSAKLENLDDYCQMRFAHNPIHHIESRIKTLDSIIEKIDVDLEENCINKVTITTMNTIYTLIKI